MWQLDVKELEKLIWNHVLYVKIKYGSQSKKEGVAENMQIRVTWPNFRKLPNFYEKYMNKSAFEIFQLKLLNLSYR